MKNHSFFLFARPSFLSGIARLLDFSGSLKVYNEHNSGAEADARAFLEDWRALGDDFRTAIAQYDARQQA
jgi:hypothetical protein